MEKRLFLTSTGTSFCDNNDIRGFTAGVIKSCEDLINALCSNPLFFPNFTPDSFTGWNEVTIDISDEIIKNKGNSAEIDSLLKKGLCDKDWIVLLCSMTVDCLYSGLAVKKYLIEGGLCNRIDIEIVEGLVEAKEVNFGKIGLPSFLHTIYEYVKKGQKDGYQVVLNPTGGYKALFSAMTIVGLIIGLEIIYFFQESEHLVTIPPLPLHVNIPAWTQVESVFDLLAGKTDYQDNRIYKGVKGKISAILIEKDTAKGLEASALVEVFRDYANKERGKPELITRTENSPLLDLLTDEQKAIFLRITEIGHLIWKGDRVPEMADHALRHHSDIFHLAERFLLPIFYYKDGFLEPHELFVLLCALYLHDCGHVIGAVKKKDGKYLRLLHTEIRDHHHVLGYLRLKYPQEYTYLGHLIYDHLCNSRDGNCNREKKWKEAWDKYLQAVATLGLYHRKKMRLRKKKNYKFLKDYSIAIENCDKEFPCLEELLEKSSLKVFDKEVKSERAVLLVALLRIIDSLDEQVSRTGDINDIRFHLAQLKAEAEEQARLANTLKLLLENDVRKKIDDFLRELQKQYKIDEAKCFQHKEDKEEEARGDQSFRRKLKNLGLDEEKKVLAFHYASACIGHFFKKFQIWPYGEKAYIQKVFINAEKEDDKVKIKIDLSIEDDPKRLSELSEFAKIELQGEEVNMVQQSGRERYKKSMLKALRNEYLSNEGSEKSPCTVVKEALNNVGIELQYGQEDG